MSGMAFRRAEVFSKRLASMSRMLDSEQSYILIKRTGRPAPLLHERWACTIKVPMKTVVADKSDTDFVRQGMAA